MSNSIRASDIRIQVRLDGVPQVPWAANSGTYTRGLTNDTFSVSGEAVPRVESVPGLRVLTVDVLDKPWVHDLLDLQESKALNEQDYLDSVIEVSFAIDYGREGSRRYLLPDCVVSDSTTTWSGGSEKVTDSLTFTCRTSKKLS